MGTKGLERGAKLKKAHFDKLKLLDRAKRACVCMHVCQQCSAVFVNNGDGH